MSSRGKPPKEVRAAIDAARAVLGEALKVEYAPNAKHHWRLRYGKHMIPLCGTPKNSEDQRRYARQWAQRVQRA